MALIDYYRCDVCGGKTFYDADVNYACPTITHEGQTYPSYPYVGDMKVVCPKCANHWEVKLAPREANLPTERYAEWGVWATRRMENEINEVLSGSSKPESVNETGSGG